MKMKRVFSIVLACALLFSAVPVLADEEDDLKAQRAAYYGALEDTNETLEALAAEQLEIQSQIKDINQDIVDMMVRIEQAKQDIADTEAQIADTEGEIAATEAEIEQTKGEIAITERNLWDAESVRDKQYEDMKKRIQYIYENGGDIGWTTMLLSSDDIESFFNKAEYAEQLHEYDRQQLEAYISTVKSIDELRVTLEEQKAQLEDEKAVLEEQKAALEDQKLALEGQKAALEDAEKELEEKLAEAEAENEDYENQIAEARTQAAQIEALIVQMNAEIARVQEEKRRAAEEAARRAAEEAARQEAARQAALQQAAAQAQAAASAASGGGYNEPVADNSAYNSAYGTSIVAYANQFVGGAYVYGGNSLTGGVDCSHFVYNVLRNTGNYSGGYATSGNWATMGSRVDSLANARAGDVIVYAGHVAIYDGNGRIVEAQNPSAGITNNRAANDDAIVAIRRFG